jgi:hypothetical protein
MQEREAKKQKSLGYKVQQLARALFTKKIIEEPLENAHVDAQTPEDKPQIASDNPKAIKPRRIINLLSPEELSEHNSRLAVRAIERKQKSIKHQALNFLRTLFNNKTPIESVEDPYTDQITPLANLQEVVTEIINEKTTEKPKLEEFQKRTIESQTNETLHIYQNRRAERKANREASIEYKLRRKLHNVRKTTKGLSQKAITSERSQKIASFINRQKIIPSFLKLDVNRFKTPEQIQQDAITQYELNFHNAVEMSNEDYSNFSKVEGLLANQFEEIFHEGNNRSPEVIREFGVRVNKILSICRSLVSERKNGVVNDKIIKRAISIHLKAEPVLTLDRKHINDTKAILNPDLKGSSANISASQYQPEKIGPEFSERLNRFGPAKIRALNQETIANSILNPQMVELLCNSRPLFNTMHDILASAGIYSHDKVVLAINDLERQILKYTNSKKISRLNQAAMIELTKFVNSRILEVANKVISDARQETIPLPRIPAIAKIFKVPTLPKIVNKSIPEGMRPSTSQEPNLMIRSARAYLNKLQRISNEKPVEELLSYEVVLSNLIKELQFNPDLSIMIKSNEFKFVHLIASEMLRIEPNLDEINTAPTLKTAIKNLVLNGSLPNSRTLPFGLTVNEVKDETHVEV